MFPGDLNFISVSHVGTLHTPQLPAMHIVRQLIYLASILFSCSMIWCYSLTNKITIEQGDLKGIVNFWDNYNAYLGIPYAVVTKRFQVSLRNHW